MTWSQTDCLLCDADQACSGLAAPLHFDVVSAGYEAVVCERRHVLYCGSDLQVL